MNSQTDECSASTSIGEKKIQIKTFFPLPVSDEGEVKVKEEVIECQDFPQRSCDSTGNSALQQDQFEKERYHLQAAKEEFVKDEFDWEATYEDEHNFAINNGPSEEQNVAGDMKRRAPAYYLHEEEDCPSEKSKGGPRTEEDWADMVTGEISKRPNRLFKCLECGFMIESRKILELHMEDHVLDKYEGNPLSGCSYNSFHFKWFDTYVEKFFMVE